MKLEEVVLEVSLGIDVSTTSCPRTALWLKLLRSALKRALDKGKGSVYIGKCGEFII